MKENRVQNNRRPLKIIGDTSDERNEKAMTHLSLGQEMSRIRQDIAYKFAICLNNTDYPASLELHKLYQILPDEDAAFDGDLRIIDESGEDYLYPAEYFVLVDFPDTTEHLLEESFTHFFQMA